MKKILATILAAALAGGLGQTAWGATEVGTWSALRTAAISGGEIVLTSDITADGDWGSIELYNDQSVELDLAGHSISVPADWFESGLISVYEGSSLTIKGGGMIDASSCESDSFTVIDNYGTMTIKSGVTIKGNDEFYAYALSCGDEGTTVVEDGVVLEGYVYPDGFTFAADGKTVVGKHTVSGGNVVVESAPTDSVVAKIGDTEYTSLAAAISDVPANGTETTIVMQADTTVDARITIVAGKNVKLDLKGKTITTATQSNGYHHYLFDNYGTLKIVDTSGSGAGCITARGILNQSGATLTLDGGTIYSCDTIGGAAVWQYEGATFIMNGGTLRGAESHESTGATCLYNPGTATIYGGQITGAADYTYTIISSGTLLVDPVTAVSVNGVHGALALSGSATVKGGTYFVTGVATHSDHVVYVEDTAQVVIEGGSFTHGGASDSGVVVCVYEAASSSTVSISGGTFENRGSQGCIDKKYWGGAATFSVSGGTFNEDVPDSYLVEGVTKTNNGNGTWTVQPPVPVVLPSVTNKVVSVNLFGALTVNAGSATNAFVAVPFGAFHIGDVKIAAADIVQAAALSAGDKMSVWIGAEGTSQKYEVYKVDANGTWVVEEHKVTVAADGTMTEGSESPESLRVPTGTGIFIERQDTSKPIYVYGQVLTNATATTTFGAGLTLVSAPETKAMASVNLNALTWNGVGPVTITTTTSGRKIVTSYANADFIYYRNAANKIVRLYYDGSRWGTVSGTWKDAGDAAVIPAGTAFWYMNNGSASVTW